MTDRDHVVNALQFLPPAKRFTWLQVFGYLLTFLFILFYFTGCAEPADGKTKCGEPNQYQCVNLCDGLFVKRKSNWNRYFANELDCNVERNPVFEEYEAL